MYCSATRLPFVFIKCIGTFSFVLFRVDEATAAANDQRTSALPNGTYSTQPIEIPKILIGR